MLVHSADAEARRLGAGGDDEVVVVERVVPVDRDGARRDVDAGDVTKAEGGGPPLAQDRPHREGDVVGCESGARHLVQERLEDVEVVAVDDGDVDVDVGALKCPRRCEPAEPRSDDHHERTGHRVLLACYDGRSLAEASSARRARRSPDVEKVAEKHAHLRQS